MNWKTLFVVFFSLSTCLDAQTNTLRVAAGTSVGSSGGISPTQIFHAQVQPADESAVPFGYAEFFFAPGFPIFGRSELSVPARAPQQTGRIYAETGNAVVGIAFTNPSDREIAISYFFTDNTGSDFGRGSTTLPANGQIARFLTEEPFNAPTPFRGTFTYSASAPVVTLAIRGFVNEGNRFLMPQVPVAELDARPTTVIPHFQDWTNPIVPNSRTSVRTELIL